MIVANETLIAFIKGKHHIKPSGNLRQDGRALRFQGEAPGGNLSRRLGQLIERGDLVETQVTKIYKRFKEEQNDPIPNQHILDFIHGRLEDIRPSGNLAQDARMLGFQAKESGSSFSQRLRQLINRGDLTEAQVTKIYQRFGEERIEPISDQHILDFIHGRLKNIKPSGNLTQDGRVLGFQAERPSGNLSQRLHKLIVQDFALRSTVERIYNDPRCNWAPKIAASEDELEQAVQEGMTDDEIRSTFNVSARKLSSWKKAHSIDDTRRVLREEFLAALRLAPSLTQAAQQLGLSEPAVLRRASRYLQMEIIDLEKTRNVRWEEAHAPDSMPADSPIAVLLCAKKLAVRFNGHGRPSLLNLEEELRIPRASVERHVELLIAQGLLLRETLAFDELAPAY